MDGMFNLGMYGLTSPKERDDDLKKKQGFFWANRDPNKIKRKDRNLSFLEGAESTGVLDDKTGAQIMPSDTRYPGANKLTTPFHPGQGNKNFEFRPDEKTGKSLAENWLGMDFDLLKKNWKDKGGFEGLMANPAFTLGLSIMQSSAQGKRIDSALMDNFIKSAGIS